MFGLPPPWDDAVRVFLAIALGMTCIALLWEGLRRTRRERMVARQLDEIDRQGVAESETSELDPLFRPAEEQTESRLPAWMVRYVPRREDINRLLERADTDWGVGTFVLLTLGVGVAGGLGVGLVFAGPAGALLVGAGAASLPYLYLRRRLTLRARAFEEHFPEAIELLGRSLRAGHALVTGLEVVSEESPAPVNQEFRQVFEQQRFGLPLQESLLGLADRVDSVDVRMFVTAVMIQRESGGNLAEILDNLATLIRERFKFVGQLRIYTAQGRMTGYLLALLPVALGVVLFGIAPDYMIVLVTEPLGQRMLIVTAVMQFFGFLWIRKIVRIDF